MQNWKKIVLLLVVLAPSIFFLSQAFSSNSANVENEKLVITGAGGTAILIKDIETVEKIPTLPELSGTGGFSLGLVKKGYFIRTSDQQKVRVIKNGDTPFIHLVTKKEEIYFNLDSEEETEEIFELVSKR